MPPDYSGQPLNRKSKLESIAGSTAKIHWLVGASTGGIALQGVGAPVCAGSRVGSKFGVWRWPGTTAFVAHHLRSVAYGISEYESPVDLSGNLAHMTVTIPSAGMSPTAPLIGSVEDLMEILGALSADGKEAWFRGHRDETWALEPSVFRSPSHRDSERSMLARFRQEAAATGLQYAFDDWGWITFAQHYSLPTRLLDWSQSPLVALYFACERDPKHGSGEFECDGEFFYLDPRRLNEEAGDSDGGNPLLLADADSRLCDYLPGRDAGHRWKPRAVIAPLLFDRIRFQTGTFTVTQVPAPNQEQEPLRQAQGLQSFRVSGERKAHLREQLDSLGFNEVTIYRDLDRIATRIKRGHERRTA